MTMTNDTILITRKTLAVPLFWCLVALVLMGGGIFRLVGLNDTSLHSDGIIHDVCKAGATPGEILTKWEKLVGNTGQLATPAAFTKLFLDVFRLAPERGNVILPSAIWGLVAMLAALWAGWKLGGRWFGLLLMSVVALNTTHIQMSRIAYFYQPCIAGSFIMAGCLIESWVSLKEKRRLDWRFHVLHILAVFLMMYSSANTWPLLCCCALFLGLIAIVKAVKKQAPLTEGVLIGGVYVVLALPLLLVSWGIPALLETTKDNAHRDYGRRIFEMLRSRPMSDVVVREFAKLGWGWTTVRMTISSLLFAAGCGVLGIKMKRDGRWGVPLVVFVVGLTLAIIAIQASSWPFGLRRVSGLWPFAYIIFAAGLAWPWLIDLPKRKRFGLWIEWTVVVAVAFGLWIKSDIAVLKTKGFPVPYRQIGQWLDSHFPKGTPVVTDRFYTAMCEFNQSDPTTNVVMISTVPNELPEIQEKTRFRDVTRQYFEENPDAAFYCCGHMYERPEVEPWTWAEQYFKRRQLCRDDHAAALSLIGQGYADYPGVIRWPEVYYNTLEDVVEIQRAKGAAGFVMWGPDWRPVQTQDYRLWRMLMSGDAILKVYGLGDKPRELTLALTGVAAGGELRLQIGDQMTVFPANQISQLNVQVKLQPGLNELRLRSRGSANARLLIGRAAIESKDAAGAK